MEDRKISEGVFVSDFKFCAHENTLTRNLTQPSRHQILAHNAELRKNKGMINDLSFGRKHLSIPLADYEVLKKRYPVLVNGSNDERTKFYLKFIKSSESLPYRVQ